MGRTHRTNSVSALKESLTFITGPPNGPVLFCGLASVDSVVVSRRLSSSSVTMPACGTAGRRVRAWNAAWDAVGGQAGHRARARSGGRHCPAGQYGYVPLGQHLVVISLCPAVEVDQPVRPHESVPQTIGSAVFCRAHTCAHDRQTHIPRYVRRL